MQKFMMKKLSVAVLAASSILAIGSVQAATTTPTTGAKIKITVSTPKGSAGADAAVTGKGIPWLPCTNAAVTLGTTTTTAFADTLQFDLDVTNADDDKEPTTKLTDYDVYIFFVNHSENAIDVVKNAFKTAGLVDISATGVATAAATPVADVATAAGNAVTEIGNTSALGGNIIYALAPDTSGFGGPKLTQYTPKQLLNAAPSTYRFMSKADFGANTSFKGTLFGGAIPVDTTGLNLPQGMWSIVTIMVRPEWTANATVTASTTPALNQTLVDPTTGSAALQNPKNWSAWAIQPFMLGTPFSTAKGTTDTGVCL